MILFSGRIASLRSSPGSYPLHATIGNVGYFANRGSVSANRQRQNTAPRDDGT